MEELLPGPLPTLPVFEMRFSLITLSVIIFNVSSKETNCINYIIYEFKFELYNGWDTGVFLPISFT